MKKQFPQFSKYAAWVLVLALFICVVSTIETAAQKKPFASVHTTRSQATD